MYTPREYSTVQETFTLAKTEDALASALAAQVGDLSSLHIPEDVGCPSKFWGDLLTSEYILIDAAERNDFDLVRSLLDAGAEIDTPRSYLSPLQEAMHSLPMVEFLLERGANVNAQISQGTALTWAASAGREELVNLLLKFGADVNLSGERDRTALMNAVDRGHVNIVRSLIEAGANVNAKDCHDFTPLEVAINRGYSEIVDMLKSRGAKASRLHNHGWRSWRHSV